MRRIYEALVEELGAPIEPYGAMGDAIRCNKMPLLSTHMEWEYCYVDKRGRLVCFGEGYLIERVSYPMEKIELVTLGTKKKRVYEDDEIYKRVVL